MTGYSNFQIPQYTPQEINSMKAATDRIQTQNLMDLNNLNLGLNMAQNLSPMGSFGFLLGNIGGRLLNNYYDDKAAERIEEAKRIKALGQGLLPNWAQKTPATGIFSSYANIPSQKWQPSNNLLRW